MYHVLYGRMRFPREVSSLFPEDIILFSLDSMNDKFWTRIPGEEVFSEIPKGILRLSSGHGPGEELFHKSVPVLATFLGAVYY